MKEKRKKTCFDAHFQYSQSKITGLSKMRSLKGLVILKCGSRTSLHAVQISDIQASLDTLFLCFVGQQAWLFS